eukprot:CAMPEP_0119047534 /NCGR_PEP_ID=MMETSP1177-20130426/53646_1 /TAXON_ID=2985 /ORGANISM="Ochromonas sp, Strain CCMP1899" /LENGTH=346 /DNA_ID=CAMNT_0007022249 /DNA_START=245 /DNA_END=1282 /DNA_ORIENTATION=+
MLSLSFFYQQHQQQQRLQQERGVGQPRDNMIKLSSALKGSRIVTHDELEHAKAYVTALELLINQTKDNNHPKTYEKVRTDRVAEVQIDRMIVMHPLSTLSEEEDRINLEWSHRLKNKLQCLYNSKSHGIYLYHIRKAAGTTIREILIEASNNWKIPFYETEGPSLNSLFFKEKVLLVTSLRDPIQRVLSLYWYEHVGWYDGVLKETHKCQTLKDWIWGWRDGSIWKKNYITKNPRNVYIEIENYYVKALSGWKGGPVGEKEYGMAKAALEKFDVVFVTEWMDKKDQINAMNSIFSIKQSSIRRKEISHQVKGDNTARKRLTKRLANDEAEMEKVLKDINVYDIRLW